MNWLFKYIRQLEEWFLFDCGGGIYHKQSELERLVEDAKKKVVWSECRGMRFVENYHEIRLLLGYEDTLGMALFIRDLIANDRVSIKECVNYLNSKQ